MEIMWKIFWGRREMQVRLWKRMYYYRGGSGFLGDWRSGLNLLGILGILSFKIWRFGDFEKNGDGDFAI